MAWTTIAHGVKGSPDSLSVTTTAVDTSLSNLIVVYVACGPQTGSAFSDSKSNTWIELTQRLGGSGNLLRTFYCVNPIVGTGHTFTYSSSPLASFPNIVFISLSGAAASPFDSETGAGASSVTSIQPGTNTPTAAGDILICGLNHDNAATVAIDSGFGIQDQLFTNGSTYVGSALATLVQGAATGVNPAYSWTGATDAAVELVSFKIAVAPTIIKDPLGRFVPFKR